MTLDVGARMKAIRKMYSLSQRELARKAGLTNSSISLIEQNRVSPSIASLKKILDAIPMSIEDFFTLELEPTRDVFYSEDEMVELGGGGISYRMVGSAFKNRKMQVVRERYAPGSDTGEEMLSYAAEEAGVVIRGHIEITVGKDVRILDAGEGYYFDCRVPHRFRNTGDEECEIVSAETPPKF